MSSIHLRPLHGQPGGAHLDVELVMVAVLELDLELSKTTLRYRETIDAPKIDLTYFATSVARFRCLRVKLRADYLTPSVLVLHAWNYRRQIPFFFVLMWVIVARFECTEINSVKLPCPCG